MPEIFSRRNSAGNLVFAVPGYDVTSYDYLLKLSNRQVPLTTALNITNFATFGAIPCLVPACDDATFDIDRYLVARGDARIKIWAAWVANAKFHDEATRVAALNWASSHTYGEGEGRLHRSQPDRTARASDRVMYENEIDVFVHPENTVPTPKIQGPNVGTASLDGITPFFQIPKVVVPAGFTDVVYEPQYSLNEAKTNYVSVLPPGTERSKLAHPMPIALTFLAGQGDEPKLIKLGRCTRQRRIIDALPRRSDRSAHN